MPSIPLGRLRWPIAAVLGVLSFFGTPPVKALDWLFTSKGRLVLLVVALVVGFWPQIRASQLAQWLTLRFRTIKPIPRRKLRKRSFALVRDMHAYAATHKASALNMGLTNRYHATQAAIEAASSEAEHEELWKQHAAGIIDYSADLRRELSAELGGRVEYVLGEYQRLGLLSDREAVVLRSNASFPEHVSDVAKRIEAIAHGF